MRQQFTFVLFDISIKMRCHGLSILASPIHIHYVCRYRFDFSHFYFHRSPWWISVDVRRHHFRCGWMWQWPQPQRRCVNRTHRFFVSSFHDVSIRCRTINSDMNIISSMVLSYQAKWKKKCSGCRGWEVCEYAQCHLDYYLFGDVALIDGLQLKIRPFIRWRIFATTNHIHFMQYAHERSSFNWTCQSNGNFNVLMCSLDALVCQLPRPCACVEWYRMREDMHNKNTNDRTLKWSRRAKMLKLANRKRTIFLSCVRSST